MDTPAVNISGTTASSYYLPSKAFIQEDVVAGIRTPHPIRNNEIVEQSRSSQNFLKGLKKLKK